VAAKVVSVNVAQPRTVLWEGKSVTTGIFKEHVEGRVKIRTLGVEGDRQADLTVHGGPEKAVYAYPAEHYQYWRTNLGLPQLPWGMFGENLTTEGLLEDTVRTGDEFRVGSTELVVTRPRFPCYKLGIKFGTMSTVKHFTTSARSGFYLAVSKEGEVGTEDAIELIGRDGNNPTITEMFQSAISNS
jgi:MOSC domain-containing protein YiiM